MTSQQESISAAGMPPGGGYGPPGGMGPGGMGPGGPGGMGPGGMGPGGPGGMGPGGPGGMGPGGMGPGGPGGMGQPVQGQPPGAPPKAPAAKGGKGGLIIGLIVGVLALGGIGGGIWYWLNSGAGALAKYAPAGTQLYVELPSTLKGLVNAAGMDIIDDKELDSDARKKEIFEGFEKSFDVKADEAEDLLTSVEAIGYASYDVGKRDKETFEDKSKNVMLIKFGSKGAVETLLESKRFEKVGDLAGGTQYKLYRKVRKSDDDDKEDKRSMFQKSFDDMGQRKPAKDEEESDSAKEFAKKAAKRNTLVWFEGEKLMAVGNEEAIEAVGKVIDGKEESLAKNDQFKKASFPGGSALIVYYDPQAIDDKDLKKELFNETGPITGSMRFDDAGILMSAHVELRGKQAPKPEVLTEDQSFSLYEKLPTDTVGYFAISGKFSGSGKDVVKAFTKALEDAEEGAGEKLTKQMEATDEMLGFDLATVIDAVGDEAILAVTADAKTDMDVIKNAAKEGRDHLGMVLIVEVGDKEKAEKIVKGLKDAVEEKAKDAFEITKKDGGFYAEPNEKMAEIIPVPGVWVTLEKEKYIFIAVGKKKTIESMKSVFEGEGDNLKGDKAHKKAISAVGAKGAGLLWIDAGRIAAVVTKDMGDEKKDLKKKGFPVDAFKLEGDDRLTIALAVRVKTKDDLITIDVDSVNGPVLGVAAGASFMFGLSRALDEPKKTDARPMEEPRPVGGGSLGDLPKTGVAECDGYLARAKRCADTMPESARKSMMDGLKQSAETWKGLASNPSVKGSLVQSCKSAEEAIAKSCP